MISSQSETSNSYYDGSKILSLTDKNGKKPGWRIVTGNRSSGKTTFFYRREMERFLKKNKQTIFLYRFKYEIENVYPKVFSPLEYWYDPSKMKCSKPYKEGFTELKYGENTLGFAVCLRSASQLKEVSNVFNHVDEIVWDEFQAHNGVYLPDEMGEFKTLYKSVARGVNKKVRYVPVIAISNFVSMLNPLMTSLDVYRFVTKDTKFLRGNGFVLEQNINLDAVQQRNDDPVLQALGDEESPEAVYLNDNTSNIKRLSGRNRYIMTYLAEGKQYGIRWYENGLLSCTKSVDKTCRTCYTKDMEYLDNLFTAGGNLPILRKRFMQGRFVFQDLECRQVMIDLLKF